jgi:hypothetical protein
MTDLLPATSGSLRERFVASMAVRGFTAETRKDDLRTVAGFAAFPRTLGRHGDGRGHPPIPILRSEQG